MTFKVDECFEHGELNEALAQHGSDVGIAVSWVQILCDWVTEVRGDHLGAFGPKIDHEALGPFLNVFLIGEALGF